jgi:protein-tyrosine kinase
VQTKIAKLALLPAGRTPENPSELLSSEKMKRLVEELKSRYEDRYIIFDATPAEGAAETTSLSHMMDSILLVVRSGRTTKERILKAVENVDRERILGVVFNGSHEPARDYKYYYGYYRKARKP